MLSSKELCFWSQKKEKKKIDLYGWADIPTFEEVWLMYNADARCTLVVVQGR